MLFWYFYLWSRTSPPRDYNTPEGTCILFPHFFLCHLYVWGYYLRLYQVGFLPFFSHFFMFSCWGKMWKLILFDFSNFLHIFAWSSAGWWGTQSALEKAELLTRIAVDENWSDDATLITANENKCFQINFAWYLFDASVDGTCLGTDVLTRKAVNKNLIDSESCQYKCLPKHIDKSQAVQFKTVW